MILPAITTRYLGPSDTRGARISARSAAKRICVAYDHSAFHPSDNHRAAAEALAGSLGWLHGHRLAQGSSPDGDGYLFVLVPSV